MSMATTKAKIVDVTDKSEVPTLVSPSATSKAYNEFTEGGQGGAGDPYGIAEYMDQSFLQETKARYRVLRPILHGKMLLTAGDLVDMTEDQALHLVETQALVLYAVPQVQPKVIEL
jgi:hypothetical protein